MTREEKGLNKCVYDFSVDYRTFGTIPIIAIHKYLKQNRK